MVLCPGKQAASSLPITSLDVQVAYGVLVCWMHGQLMADIKVCVQGSSDTDCWHYGVFLAGPFVLS